MPHTPATSPQSSASHLIVFQQFFIQIIMLRHRLLTIIAALSLVVFPVAASAALTPGNTGLSAAAQGTGLVNVCGTASGSDCIATIIGRVIQVVLGLIGILLIGLLIYAGFLWMTAGGDKDKVTTARTMIINAVAGIVIVAVSYAVASFVLSQLSFVATGEVPVSPGTGNPGAPPPPGGNGNQATP